MTTTQNVQTSKERCFKKWDIVFVLLVLVAIGAIVYVSCCCNCDRLVNKSAEDLRVAKLQDKLDALKRLNEERIKAQLPPLNLIDLDATKWRVEQIKRRIDAYDEKGRHPVYWYTRLDGGLYGVEQVIVWTVRERVLAETPTDERVSFKEGAEVVLGKRRDAVLNPCYNYIDMEAVIVEEHFTSWPNYRLKNIWKVYVFYMVAKWIDWVSLPTYMDGRFTAEGYVNPVIRPVAFVVRYAPYERPHLNPRATYRLGAVYFCKYLNPLADCKDVRELEGNFTVRKVLDDGRWYIRIDTKVQLDKPGLYTFEIIAEDLRFQGQKCSIMHYTVEVPPNR